ncbi:MAG: hypothetical protein K8R99_09700 [Actinomycetia bacterium]|nr:hypothetical protein [Actinomycetes bacterium]
MRTSRLLASVAALGLIAVGCSDDKKSSDTTAAADTTIADTAAATTVADETPTNPDPVKVELLTGSINIEQTTFVAGTINFEATNIEETPHVFAIAKGEFDALPKTGNGAIDLEALGDDFIAKTGLLMPGLGTTKVITVDLAPGTYVIYCNGGDDESKGEVSHVSAGEYVVITVV